MVKERVLVKFRLGIRCRFGLRLRLRIRAGVIIEWSGFRGLACADSLTRAEIAAGTSDPYKLLPLALNISSMS